jgi:hypothetical protein
MHETSTFVPYLVTLNWQIYNEILGLIILISPLKCFKEIKYILHYWKFSSTEKQGIFFQFCDVAT